MLINISVDTYLLFAMGSLVISILWEISVRNFLRGDSENILKFWGSSEGMSLYLKNLRIKFVYNLQNFTED
jgi:hypothetical protein